jgi:hypothetical protein
MDIWKWVFDLQRELRDAGQGRIADLIDSIPEDKYRSRAEQVAAALPEAIAAARAMKNPWLELYFRHWGLSNRMNNLAEGEVALADAVSLIEFAHRDATKNCPQTVCATQDVAICYGNMDGPGWAAERLAVCEETLARINPEWPCFSCISGEYADALLDAGRPQEALDFLAQQAAALAEQGEELTPSYQALQAYAMWRAGRANEALRLLDEIDRMDVEADEDDPEEQCSRAVLRANILASDGQLDAAATVLPLWEDLPVRSVESWSEAACLLAQRLPQRNTWQLGRALQASLRQLSKVGAHFDAAVVALRHAELALLRGAPWTAAQALACAQPHLNKLRSPAELRARAADALQQLQALPATASLPVPAAQLMDYLQAQVDPNPEQGVEWLLAACAQHPDDTDLAQTAASALMACGMLTQAWSHLWQFVVAHPLLTTPIYQLMGSLLEAGEYAELQRLAQAVAEPNPSAALWIRGQAAHRQQRWAEVAEHMQSFLALQPDTVGAQHLWALAATAQHDLPTALRLRKALAALAPAPSNAHWDVLTIASASQDWDSVREFGTALGLELDAGPGPVEQNLGLVMIRFEHQGQYSDLFARRTGPVTARILAPSFGGMPQHLHDWIAFDAEPLTEQNEDVPSDAKPRISTFRSVYTIEAGGFGESCFVDGAAPSDKAFTTFEQALEAHAWHCWSSSPPDYTVVHPTSGHPLRGRYFMVSAPASVRPAQIDQRLRELTAQWPHPVCWPRFAEKAGLDTERHTDIVERYGL